MKIGDKVRLLHTNDEGRIINFKDKNIVEIEIEDGFVIPVMRNEVVIISREESEYFGDKPSSGLSYATQYAEPEKAKIPGVTGVFLGYVPINENDISLYLFNFTARDVMYNVSEISGDLCKSCAHGNCIAGKNQFITYFKMSNFESWTELRVQLIFVNQILELKQKGIDTLFKPKAKSFFNSKKIIPTIEKEGYLIEIKNGSHADPLESLSQSMEGEGDLVEQGQLRTLSKSFSEELKTQILSPKTGITDYKTTNKMKGVILEVDLHIEQLGEDFKILSPEEIINRQMATFEKELDNAILSHAESIKFIHGIGNGVLRHKIHKYLSQSENIRYFEDADKGKFGFGATIIHL